MFKFGGEKIKPLDPDFEKAKKDTEVKNRNETRIYLASKFTELISENPIVVYTQHEGFKPEDKTRSFDKVQEVRTDESGTGGNISVNFDYDDWVAVDKNGFRASYFFDRAADHYKISKDSADHIIRMMNELIKRSGYSEQEKEKMSDAVFNNFRNKIISQEDISKVQE